MASAYCHGPNSPYGCGHHAEHVEAARKGWLTRRGHYGAAAREDERWFQALFPDATHVHTHESHKDRVTFRQRGKWFELPLPVYKGLVKEGREAIHERDRQEALAAKQAHAERVGNERVAILKKRLRLRNEIAETQMNFRLETSLHHEAAKPFHEFMRRIRGAGVRPHKSKKREGHYIDRDEISSLGPGVMRYNGRYTMDNVEEAFVESGLAGYNPEYIQDQDFNDIFREIDRLRRGEDEWANKRARYQSQLKDLRKELAALPTLATARKKIR